MSSKQIQVFIADQLREWNLASANYAGLKHVRTKTMDFGQFQILVQFNPKRIISTGAKVDAKSIEARPCFLCSKNLPTQQRSLTFKENYLILVNPFPIFREHLTIPKTDHTPQHIQGNFEDMLDLCQYLQDFTLIYNGPKCGASAPDHFHFQAGIKGFMPIEKDFAERNNCYIVSEYEHVTLFSWNDYLRGLITIEGSDKKKILALFENFLYHFSVMQPDEAEPLLNIVSWFEKGNWIVHLFPRKAHRPEQYFETGEEQILLSPASVDMGGALITPREEDFSKINKSDIEDIFRQVCLGEDEVNQLVMKIKD
jgi:hypothetical protein